VLAVLIDLEGRRLLAVIRALPCDAALVGFANAGKSALFDALTAPSGTVSAPPLDAPRKMPRLAPIAGVTPPLVLADIGGVSRGSAGKNPGARWLGFVRAARLVIITLALREEAPPRASRRLRARIAFLQKVLAAYTASTRAPPRIPPDTADLPDMSDLPDTGLSGKPRIIALNVFNPRQPLRDFQESAAVTELASAPLGTHERVIAVNAATGEGISVLKTALKALITASM
jgi:hypothetical protein